MITRGSSADLFVCLFNVSVKLAYKGRWNSNYTPLPYRIPDTRNRKSDANKTGCRIFWLKLRQDNLFNVKYTAGGYPVSRARGLIGYKCLTS